MNAVEYTRGLRRVATISWLASLALFLIFAATGLLTLGPHLPFLALAVGSVPIAIWTLGTRPTCERCGGQLRIIQGFPRIVFGCRRCSARIDTGIHPDF